MPRLYSALVKAGAISFHPLRVQVCESGQYVPRYASLQVPGFGANKLYISGHFKGVVLTVRAMRVHKR